MFAPNNNLHTYYKNGNITRLSILHSKILKSEDFQMWTFDIIRQQEFKICCSLKTLISKVGKVFSSDNNNNNYKIYNNNNNKIYNSNNRSNNISNNNNNNHNMENKV